MYQTDELRSKRLSDLMSPHALLTALPMTAGTAESVINARSRIEDILTGHDHRLLVVIGPCSIHHPESALEYAHRLAELQRHYQERLEIVMRAYFEKPRTVVGWKGLLADPYLDGSFDVNEGLRLARRLLLDVNQLGLPTATEFLDTVTGQYIADVISWGAIGARTTESQIHREMASALSCPVGFKNGTDGNVRIAIDAIRAARASHMFLSQDKQGRMAVYQTQGNPFGHVILRGGAEPNYQAEYIATACDALRTHDLPARLVVDCSHGNSQKQFQRQLVVAEDICRQIRTGSNAIAGVMVESFLEEGNQPMTSPGAMAWGKSITDACLGWEDSTRLLSMLADAVDSRIAR
ncbi:3-deoxy-7-phosphoheptulonate synthase [Musicola keenii]|uniref:3-deoxy-7-phosphoheptulonate synthase n=1 Tax=Musicola keenii TaxID=2884250 RepID=UPI0017857182|nr:3-deoxy-7-phosphoheptulonate synthase [Musicola keenii]